MNRPGLRERKKLKTRRAIQEAALRLFAEQGYDATTVDQIAAAADVSPATFFRYFPTKEHTVTEDEYDPGIIEVWRSQPHDLPPLEAARRTMHTVFAEWYATDRDRILDRARLMLSVPQLRARIVENTRQTERMIRTLIAEHAGTSPDDLAVRVLASGIMGVWMAAIEYWVEHPERELPEVLDAALGLFQAGVRAQPGPSGPPSGTPPR